MQGLRSRAGIVAMAVGAVALLSVPMVAAGKGPPDLVGEGTDTAGTVVPPQAKVPDPPPGKLHAPASKPAPPAQPAPPVEAAPPGPAGEGPSGGKARGLARGRSGSAPPRRKPKPAPTPSVPGSPAGHAGTPAGSEPAGGGGEPGSVPEERSPSGSPEKPKRTSAPERPASADERDTGDGAVAGALVGDTVELPEDASPDTLPFTGLQLALMALSGFVIVAAGLALRRTATR